MLFPPRTFLMDENYAGIMNKCKPMKNNRNARQDISLALIHLAGNRENSSAKAALASILREGLIRGSGNAGYIKGNKPAVCFTEMPLSALHHFVQTSRPTKHPYEYFGIALSKQSGWERGARPVVYLPDTEALWIPPEQKWRHVRFEPGDVDFSHEREWRVEGDFNLNGVGFYVIVPDKQEEDELRQTLHATALQHILGFLHIEILSQFV